MNHGRAGGKACASHLAMDRWLAGELRGAEAAALVSHVETCARCRRTLDDFARARAAFPTELPWPIAERIERASEARETRKRWVPTALGVLAVAAALVLWLRRPTAPLDVDPAASRSKGSPHITFYVQHEGAVRRGAEGEHLVPGDAVEFAYAAPESVYLAILSVDGARHASAYYARAGRAARVGPARELPLDQSTVLDDILGVETIYALFCDRAVEVAPLVDTLASEPEWTPSVEGCVVDRHTFVKARP